jgi:O6-methylguanine-DNA--protein-cysteine methyltransferase
VENDNQKILVETERQLDENFAGKRDVFSIPLDMRGTTFQKDVWLALQRTQFGKTRSYGEIARQLGSRVLVMPRCNALKRRPGANKSFNIAPISTALRVISPT